jgi:hypothetical protein
MLVLLSIYVVTIVLMLGTNTEARNNLTQHTQSYNNISVPQVAINP